MSSSTEPIFWDAASQSAELPHFASYERKRKGDTVTRQLQTTAYHPTFFLSNTAAHYVSNVNTENCDDFFNAPRAKRVCTRIEDFTFTPPTFQTPTTNQTSNHTPVEWWKRKKTPNKIKDSSVGHCCFICHSVPPPSTQDQRQTNSILSYFSSSCQTAHSIRTDGKYRRPLTSNESLMLTSCAFCERSACGDCVGKCESCGGEFCRLCSTVDYDGGDERQFCLDCYETNGRVLADRMRDG